MVLYAIQTLCPWLQYLPPMCVQGGPGSRRKLPTIPDNQTQSTVEKVLQFRLQSCMVKSIGIHTPLKVCEHRDFRNGGINLVHRHKRTGERRREKC